ncbi:hypothetical protein [Chryseobacterium camelliae]|uniref:hypothetical protein n=1 Tax=Chryseobacterium camelliae TaxID=1265445 RepID=UPI000C1C9068|nr:hypothetical protein [Chryseobacterium camelliae]
MMNATAEILKKKIESFHPDLLETLAKVVEKLENRNRPTILPFHRDEILYRIQFHNEHPHTKLDFYENISELEKLYA